MSFHLSKYYHSFQQTSNGGSFPTKTTSKLLMCKSRKGGNYRFNSGCITPTVPSSESGRLYLFEAVLSTANPVVPGTRRSSLLSLQGYGSDSNTIWKHMDFWETLFYGINENIIEYLNIRNTITNPYESSVSNTFFMNFRRFV